jgi:hypothetical protein
MMELAGAGPYEAIYDHPSVRAEHRVSVDTNLKRVVRHTQPTREDMPEIDRAQSILEAEASRRETLFKQSVEAERTRGDALSRRFEEALKQAREEPVTKPQRDFDLD